MNHFLFDKRKSELNKFENLKELREFINRNLEENQFDTEDFENGNLIIIEGEVLNTEVKVQFEVEIFNKKD